jgi:hypothetical protein
MSKLVGIAGPSGHGKSSSIRTLDPKETLIINIAGKDLPFPGSKKKYNKSNKNYLEATTADGVVKILQKVSKSLPNIKYVIIDDYQYIVGMEFVDKALEKGYDKFSSMAQNIVKPIKPSLHQSLRDDLYVVILTHDEVVEKEYQQERKMKTAGKLVDQHITLEGFFSVVLFTEIVKKEEGEFDYCFRTRTDGVCNSKSPMGMFEDSRIPNDLQYVFDKMKTYYQGEGN